MTRKLCTAGALHHTRRLPSNCPPHIWISERQLAETFRAFASSPKRHGSNVPGPMEAMRRASKRKNTNMAWQGSGAAPIDSAIVLSTNPQSGWWKKAEGPTQEAVSTSWIWPFLKPPKPPPLLALEETFQELPTNVIELEQSLREELQSARGFEDIQSILRHLNVDIRRKPELCSVIMEEIFASEWSYTQISTFLLEPELNPPGARNYLEAVKHYAPKELALTAWETLEDALIRATELGLNDALQTRPILRSLCRLAQSSSSPVYTQRYLSLCVKLFEALENSEVQSRSDLGEVFCGKLLNIINVCDFVPAKAQLLWILKSHSRISYSQLALQINLDWLEYLVNHKVYNVGDYVEFISLHPPDHLLSLLLATTEQLALTSPKEDADVAHERQTSEEARRYLKRLSLSIRRDAEVRVASTGERSLKATNDSLSPRDIILTTTDTRGEQSRAVQSSVIEQQSVASPTDISRQATRLELWFSLLSRLNTKVDLREIIRAGSMWWSCKETAVLKPHHRVLVHCWTAMALSYGHPDASEQLGRSGLNHALHEAIRNMPNPGTDDLLGRILIALDDLPLPAKDQLLARLKDLTNHSLVAKGRYRYLREELRESNGGEFARLRDSSFHHRLSASDPLRLTELAELVNSDLSRFESLARQLIRRNVSAGFVVQKVLMHNRQLQFILARAWPTIEERRSLQSSPKPAQTLGGTSRYTPQQIVDLVHNIATEFALSPVLTARQAFRKVYFCYLFLHRRGGPILPHMTRALWHTVITRRNGATSFNLVKWLLGKVTEHEGIEVARKLLLSSSFRHVRSLELEAFCKQVAADVKTTDHEVKEPRDMDRAFDASEIPIKGPIKREQGHSFGLRQPRKRHGTNTPHPLSY